MRVVAGSARGLRLSTPPGRDTRPTTDRVREATFNALESMDAIDGSRVLDLFAGSGALGIEALSRGADHCVFVERDRAALSAIADNLATTRFADLARVVPGEAEKRLATLMGPFDLVLLDPPHETDRWPHILNGITPLLHPDAVVVAESSDPVIDPVEVEEWIVARERRYGSTVVQMLRLATIPTSPSE